MPASRFRQGFEIRRLIDRDYPITENTSRFLPHVIMGEPFASEGSLPRQSALCRPLSVSTRNT
jgi:hypothetical protein